MALHDRQVSGRLSLDVGNFSQIAETMARDTGIELPEHKLPLVQSRILKRLQILGLPDFHAYCAFVETPAGAKERIEMFSALTTNVTGFFREAHHFETLKQRIIPQISAKLKAGKSVRLWSAGCSSGEEPYSLALTCLSAIPGLENLDFKILATDIDPTMLAKGKRGIYSTSDVAPIPLHLLRAYFSQSKPTADRFSISQSAKDIVVFKHLNLMDDWPLTRTFDVILCRNVVIYFGDAAKTRVWSKLLSQLHPKGILVTGHSERLCGPAATQLKLISTTTYCREDIIAPTTLGAPCR